MNMNSFVKSRELQANASSRFGIGTASDWLSLPLDSEITFFQDWAAVTTSSFESYQFGNAVFLDEVNLHKSTRSRLDVVKGYLDEINPTLLIVETSSEELVDVPNTHSVAVDVVLTRTKPSEKKQFLRRIWSKAECLENWDALLDFYETRAGASDFLRWRFDQYRKRLLREFPKNNCNWFAALEDKSIVGAVGVFWGEAYGSVQELYVNSEHRRTGIGTELIEYVIHNRPSHCQLVAVADREDGAERFYRKLGFQFQGIQQWIKPRGNGS
jgi:ribosomal protein S18 acetylase RimI-like enzyme